MKTKDARTGTGGGNGRVKDIKSDRARVGVHEPRLTEPHTFRVHTLPLRSRKRGEPAASAPTVAR